MAGVKRRTVLALTVGVWLAAIGSATALTYELNRPLSPSATSWTLTSSAVAPSDLRNVTAPEGAQAQSVLYIPVITIVGQTPRREPLVREPKVARDISKMNCADWRELDMGSGHVQICE
jgi:hypothetical protein